MSKLRYLTINDFILDNSHRNFFYCIDNSVKWTLGTKVVAKCITHNLVYTLVPKTFMNGAGCPLCRSSAIGNGLRKAKTDFIDKASKIHQYRYDYSMVHYVNSSTKITIICKTHGEFTQTPSNHIHSKNGCPKCKIAKIIPNFKTTMVGKSESRWLDKLGITIRQHPIGVCFVDGFDPATNTVYEFLGDFWHGNPNLYSPFDINPRNKKSFADLYNATINRFDYLNKLGYTVIYIWQSDYRKDKSPTTYNSLVKHSHCAPS